jgi:TolA-binding protein
VSEHLQVTSPAELAAAVEQAAQEVKTTLEHGLEDVLALIQDAEHRRDQALSTLMRLEGHISERLQEEYIRRSEDAVQEVDNLEGKKRTIEAGLIRLEDDLRRVRLNVLQPLADATLWTNPDQREVLKRALALLVKKVVVYPAPQGARPERIDVELASVTELLQ